jgi:hypothetical protein
MFFRRDRMVGGSFPWNFVAELSEGLREYPFVRSPSVFFGKFKACCTAKFILEDCLY